METSSRKPKYKEIDRISYLPDDVLHYILSFLYIFDVLQLTILSKKWYNMCKTMPYLDFNIDRFGCERVKTPSPWNHAMAYTFKDFINWVLSSQRATTLVRFKLYCGNLFDKVVIFRWIRVVAMRNVQELVLSFRIDNEALFDLPYCLSTCESLQVLKLRLNGAILKLPNHLGFCQLKYLHLLEVELSNEHLTSCLFSKCTLLEKLILGDCTFGTMAMLEIDSTSLLYVALINLNNSDTIESYSRCTVKISCPNLKVLKYKAPTVKDIIIDNLFSIEVVHIFFYEDLTEEIGMLVHKMIKNVDSTSVLKLCMTAIRGLDRVAHGLRNFSFMLYNLKCLKLAVGIDGDCMRVMILLLKHSPNLEVLNLWSDENFGWDENWQLHDPSEKIVCLESHLKFIRLTGFKYEENEMELLRFFLKNAHVLEKLMIVWAEYAEISEEASEEVLKYPRTSSHVVVTFLDVNPKQRSGVSYNKV